eukprot:CAMPEP_0183433348 /NCGR_PEP_ID=MMETSP0370-20130417/61336_1 /TAXON_ID=268820 /ORGANISM="Peridinium aciculiferum, Strain PAER-2" /LENGTH=67 /DNA_ID=CAMNT_0025619667 /DNA_START=325 /DNA_END=525 /DNA_ORIENTATION=-
MTYSFILARSPVSTSNLLSMLDSMAELPGAFAMPPGCLRGSVQEPARPETQDPTPHTALQRAACGCL